MSTNPTINFGPSMLTLSLLFIGLNIDPAIFRGLLNYLIMNAILSIGSITSPLMSNSLLLIIIINDGIIGW